MKTMFRISIILFYTLLGLCFCSTAFAEGGNFTIPTDTTVIGDEVFANCAEMISVNNLRV